MKVWGLHKYILISSSLRTQGTQLPVVNENHFDTDDILEERSDSHDTGTRARPHPLCRAKVQLDVLTTTWADRSNRPPNEKHGKELKSTLEEGLHRGLPQNHKTLGVSRAAFDSHFPPANFQNVRRKATWMPKRDASTVYSDLN